MLLSKHADKSVARRWIGSSLGRKRHCDVHERVSAKGLVGLVSGASSNYIRGARVAPVVGPLIFDFDPDAPSPGRNSSKVQLRARCWRAAP
jgi:hypothetical protein